MTYLLAPNSCSGLLNIACVSPQHPASSAVTRSASRTPVSDVGWSSGRWPSDSVMDRNDSWNCAAGDVRSQSRNSSPHRQGVSTTNWPAFVPFWPTWSKRTPARRNWSAVSATELHRKTRAAADEESGWTRQSTPPLRMTPGGVLFGWATLLFTSKNASAASSFDEETTTSLSKPLLVRDASRRASRSTAGVSPNSACRASQDDASAKGAGELPSGPLATRAPNRGAFRNRRSSESQLTSLSSTLTLSAAATARQPCATRSSGEVARPSFESVSEAALTARTESVNTVKRSMVRVFRVQVL
ncbi:unnamed protein product [Pelagomonas calceolata]|uniref:Uncharacterized protein n=1 Tax=Pelagomonas calceolata TaxID=35677 RepID=A0A8J2WX38_9STRA|nr:unnamed protein product [Pelagomonas calceolata]